MKLTEKALWMEQEGNSSLRAGRIIKISTYGRLKQKFQQGSSKLIFPTILIIYQKLRHFFELYKVSSNDENSVEDS